MRITYRPAAIADIQRATDYIAKDLKNPIAAGNLRRKILRGVSQLKQNPFMGTLLSSKYDDLDDSDIRFFVIEKYLVFYQPHSDSLEVIRILDGRWDYMRLLF